MTRWVNLFLLLKAVCIHLQRNVVGESRGKHIKLTYFSAIQPQGWVAFLLH